MGDAGLILFLIWLRHIIMFMSLQVHRELALAFIKMLSPSHTSIAFMTCISGTRAADGYNAILTELQ